MALCASEISSAGIAGVIFLRTGVRCGITERFETDFEEDFDGDLDGEEDADATGDLIGETGGVEIGDTGGDIESDCGISGTESLSSFKSRIVELTLICAFCKTWS